MRKISYMGILFPAYAFILLLAQPGTSFSADPGPNTPPTHIHDELEAIKERLNIIERDSERRRILGEEKGIQTETFFLQTFRKTRFDGGLTFIVQGGINNEARFGGDRADSSLSIDIILESKIQDNGILIVRGGFMRGDGLSRLPELFAGSVNADIEAFPDASARSFHLIEAFYEHSWEKKRYRVSFGQIDLTSYFDRNAFANSETFQFISPLFVNNIAIAWGGDDNGYGPGLVFHLHPMKNFEVSLGLFEGNGDYKDTFDQPFWIAEMEFKRDQGELEGNYRFIVWSNETDRPTILNPNIMKSYNRGFGISFNQKLTPQFGVWGRFGLQDGEVSHFSHHASLGAQFKGVLSRPDDVIGIALAITSISNEQKQFSGFNPVFNNDEYAAEIYYNLTTGHGFHVTPDVQYISNPGGDGGVDPITVYGIRTQLVF